MTDKNECWSQKKLQCVQEIFWPRKNRIIDRFLKAGAFRMSFDIRTFRDDLAFSFPVRKSYRFVERSFDRLNLWHIFLLRFNSVSTPIALLPKPISDPLPLRLCVSRFSVLRLDKNDFLYFYCVCFLDIARSLSVPRMLRHIKSYIRLVCPLLFRT